MKGGVFLGGKFWVLGAADGWVGGYVCGRVLMADFVVRG